MKVICINAGDISLCKSYGMVPLEEGKTYTVREETVMPRGEGYLLHEIHNRCNIKDLPGVEPSYLKERFIPLSDIDETVELETMEKYLTVQS